MFKKKSSIYFIIVTVIVLIILTSCDARKGMLNVNEDPTIIITNYFGADSTNLITEPQLFQQTVQWSGTDEDGWIEGYAFRVLNEDSIAIATPGYDAIDENGWVKFYTPNADLSIPLNQSAQTTIWNDQSYATINFPAADANGDSANVISILEVKCIDNSGNVSKPPAVKYFQAHSNTPRVLLDLDIAGETISTAIIFSFIMKDDDPVVGEIPYYFNYKLERQRLDGSIINENEGGYTDEWISTLGLPDVSLALHSALNGNALIPNEIIDDIPQDSTFLRIKAVDTALIESNELEISFVVKEGFYPGTFIYFGDGDAKANGIYSLGTDHFADYLDEALSDILPSVLTSNGVHYATAFWFNSEETYSAIGSSEFKTYMRWGYYGEHEENNPHKRTSGIAIDELTGNEYFCAIVGYDIRLDGNPYYYPPIPAEGINLQVDNDGKEWLRVSVNDAIGKSTTVTLTSYGGSLDDMYGEHTFEVRAIDLQGAVDLTPHELNYTIEPPVLKEEKSGVMIIDDESGTNTEIEVMIDSLYNYYISDYTTEIDSINRGDVVLALGDGDALHYGKSIIAPSDLQQYKTIIYHCDSPIAEFNFWKEYEAFKIYLLQGGNLILSGGMNIEYVFGKCFDNGFNIFEDYFGIPMDNNDAIGRVSTSFTENPFFIKAIAEDGYNDIDLLLPSFDPAITNPMAPILSVEGLGPIAYFNDHEADVIYSYGCKEVGEDPPGCPYHIIPTQEEYDEFNGLSIALKYETIDNSCYVFGFPLAYMEPDQVKSMMTQILNDLP
ncbi:MAG: hypothetical protein P9M11_11995 [Candidatus Tenebribacter burtonii]|nr:hypothetical protein [Candidatus Tenebribacter burtonii]